MSIKEFPLHEENNDLLFIKIDFSYGSWPNLIKLDHNKYAILTNHYTFSTPQLTSRNIAIDLLHKLQKFYSTKSQKDIDKINHEIEKQSKQGIDEKHYENMPTKGYIYFLQAKNIAVKIGKTINLQNRFNQIQPRLPFETQVICTIKTSDYTLLENKFHKLFYNKHVNGEWFKLTNNDIKDIENRKLPQDILDLIINIEEE